MGFFNNCQSMEKAYSLLSWNVEHFGKSKGAGSEQRCERITQTIIETNPDVLALYEVEGSEVFYDFAKYLPTYTFHITEGPQTQEILVGVKSGITAFFTQRVRFKSGLEYLRPGALLTLTIEGNYYPILFLHLKSSDDPRSFGLRDDMIRRAIKFSKVLRLDEIPANYLFIGDLNTMGMNYYYDRDISPETELRRSERYAGQWYDLKRMEKTFEKSWNNGSDSSYDPANLDHCYAAKHMQFKLFPNKDREGQSPVDVRGWVDISAQEEQDEWIDQYSDHSMLYLEVQRVID